MKNQQQGGLMPFREHVLTAEAYLLCTPAGRVRYASATLKQMVEEDLTGRNLNDFVEDATAARLIAGTLAGDSCDFGCTIGGQVFTCRAQPWEDGEGIQILLFPVNPTGKKTDSAGVARFMAREIDRELSVLLPAVQLLEESGGQAEPAAIARLHLYRLLRMSRNVEEMALAESGDLHLYRSQIDLVQLLQEILAQTQPCCDACGILLHSRLPEEPVLCWVDEQRVRSMVTHLLTNAIAAQRDGGAVSLTLQVRENGDMVLAITDRGQGMGGNLFGKVRSTAQREDLLNPGGLGLGLELTRIYAEAHGGQMMLMSGEEGGLAVRITLPRGEEQAPDEMHTWRASYGAGIDPLLVELSPVAPRALYLNK